MQNLITFENKSNSKSLSDISVQKNSGTNNEYYQYYEDLKQHNSIIEQQNKELRKTNQLLVNKIYEFENSNNVHYQDSPCELSNIILNNLSHELRTPLNGILGFTKILKNDIADKKLLDLVSIIEISGERLKKTLNDLLILAELETKKYEYKFEECELTSFIEMYDNSAKELFQEKPVDFVIDIKNQNINIMTDKYLLHQTINNLLDNAYKFTEKGSITITVSKRKIYDIEKAIIEISDTGIGIESEKLELIFKPFRQGSEGIRRRHEGMGLGLTIVQKIIKKLSGEININSIPGEGTNVSLIFNCV